MSVYDLIRGTTISPGQEAAGQLAWHRLPSREEIGRIEYSIVLDDAATAHVRLTYTADGRPVDQRIALDRTPCRFGGWRWWFVCPVTDRRVLKLYASPSAPWFASREVHRLAYQSSRNSDLQRSHDRLRRLHIKLRAAYPFQGDLPARPRWMHASTYERLICNLAQADMRRGDLCLASGESFLRRLA